MNIALSHEVSNVVSHPPRAANSRWDFITRVLSQPYLDRTIALAATLPFVWLAYYRYQHTKLGFPLISLTIGVLILLVTMIVRRPPKRITPNPLYWLLAFVATYWPALTVGLIQKGNPLVPDWVTEIVGLLSLLVTVLARLSLGRNIGFVPAQREIVTNGAYSYMRHPIYTGLFLGYVGLALRAFSLQNALILALGITWFVIKSVVEEKFLSADPQYASYLQRVRARWIPFVL
jgi:protein-S-isoprenylcysteine O-methyltransferase Ste14